MQELLSSPQLFSFGDVSLQLSLPDTDALPNDYSTFWAKLWPASIALSEFLATNGDIAKGKTVLELAAGLGLSGMVAAHFASEVLLSDYMPEAVALMRSHIALNGLRNTTCRELDILHLPQELKADVVLMSDINYEPSLFPRLYEVVKGFLDRGSIVILSTPQRLMAKPFIERLLPCCISQEEREIEQEHERTFISILVLVKPEL